MKRYQTVAVRATNVAQVLNKVNDELARNPKLEWVTGNDYVVYLTYSYLEEDERVWTVKFIFTMQEGYLERTHAEVARVTRYEVRNESVYSGQFSTREEAVQEAEIEQAIIDDSIRTRERRAPAPAPSPALIHDNRTTLQKYIDRFYGVR